MQPHADIVANVPLFCAALAQSARSTLLHSDIWEVSWCLSGFKLILHSNEMYVELETSAKAHAWPGKRGTKAAITSSPMEYLNFVAGAFVPAACGEWVDVTNPATNEVVGRVPRSRAEDVNAGEMLTRLETVQPRCESCASAAADAALAAFHGPWSKTTAEQRAVYLEKISAAIEVNS
jgi:hypothetical protein